MKAQPMNPKPCPFCGEQPQVRTLGNTYAIQCENMRCDFSPGISDESDPNGPWKVRNDVMARWNRRASISAETAKRLADLLRHSIYENHTYDTVRNAEDVLAAYDQEKQEGV